MFTLFVTFVLVLLFLSPRTRPLFARDPGGWLGTIVGLWIGGTIYATVPGLLTFPLAWLLLPIITGLTVGSFFSGRHEQR